MRPLLVAAALALLSAPAFALLPEPGPAPDWEAEKGAVYESFSRVEAAYPSRYRRDDVEIRRLLKQLRDLGLKIESDDRRQMNAELLFVRDRGVPGQDPAELSRRIRYVHDTRMHVAYGWMLPQAFNEAFKDASATMTFPGYPLRLYTSDAEYCSDYDALGREVISLLAPLDSRFAPRPGDRFCDKVVVSKAP